MLRYAHIPFIKNLEVLIMSCLGFPAQLMKIIVAAHTKKRELGRANFKILLSYPR